MNYKTLKVLCIFGLVGACSGIVSAQTTVDYGTGYTMRSQNSVGGRSAILSRLQSGIGRANRQYRNTGTNTRPTNRYRTLFPNYDENGRNDSRVLSDWTNFRVGRNGSNQTQLAWARARRLDLLSFTSTSGPNRGIASGDFSVVRASQANVHTRGHELGHNFSATHGQGNRLQASSRNDLGFTRYTVMRSGGQSNGNIIDFFSDDTQKFRRASLGNGSLDNTKRIRNARFGKADNR